MQRAYLASLSPWFELALAREGKDTGKNAMVRLGDVSPVTIKLFIYWLFTSRVPELEDFEPKDVSDESEYQIQLIQAVKFAEERQIFKMQNDVMLCLARHLKVEHDMTLPVLQKGLLKSRGNTVLRKLLLREAVWLETNKQRTTGDFLIQVDAKYVDGYDHDLKVAREEFERDRQARRKAEAYLVFEGSDSA